ncbi:hypothetical protein [Azospirillum isscasi]|uniref:DUF3159 domain-containing protein n=1 Tax=Azospirillum isscasi TaxID=3053926 RepID=A0ABU0WQ69_9PROT|nr:hypothetical protein [Azospirillum isscasi]MDQ2106386.1 hypothetical protein [Azospirillum isscasi]
MDAPPLPFPVTPAILQDGRFVLSRMVLGTAAASWMLASPVLGMLPPFVLAVIPVVAALALVAGRFDLLAKLAAAGAFVVGALGWWIARGPGGDVTVALVSALPAGWLIWYVLHLLREDDRAGLWNAPHAVSAAMACCAVIACGAWSVALWALREGGHAELYGLQVALLWVWMLASLWCANTGYPALKAMRERFGAGSAPHDRLQSQEGVALFGVWFAPWALGAATLFIDVAGRGPFDHLLHPERTMPLWVSAIPLVVGLSALNALRVLHALLTAPRLAADAPRDAMLEEDR